MLRSVRLLLQICSFTILVILGGGVCGALWLHAHGSQLLSVQSTSMYPTFDRGDALLVEPASPARLAMGDVVSYADSHDSRVIVSHRIVGLGRQNRQFTTAGDALGTIDKPVSEQQLVGKAVAVAPDLGYILDCLHRPGVIMALVGPPVLYTLYREGQRFYGAQSITRYSVRGQVRQ